MDITGIMDQWRGQTATIGTRVRVETINQTFEGTAVDVDDNGSLIIETQNNERQTIIYGDCFHAYD